MPKNPLEKREHLQQAVLEKQEVDMQKNEIRPEQYGHIERMFK